MFAPGPHGGPGGGGALPRWAVAHLLSDVIHPACLGLPGFYPSSGDSSYKARPNPTRSDLLDSVWGSVRDANVTDRGQSWKAVIAFWSWAIRVATGHPWLFKLKLARSRLNPALFGCSVGTCGRCLPRGAAQKQHVSLVRGVRRGSVASGIRELCRLPRETFLHPG